ncbi:hypothetical protein D3C72_2105450 [compost metagenome]
MIDRLLPVSDALHGKHREAVHFIVVTGMVAIRTFRCHLTGMNHPFEDDFSGGWHLQIIAPALDQLGTIAAQQASERVLG